MSENALRSATQGRDAAKKDEKRRHPQPAPEAAGSPVNDFASADRLLGMSTADPPVEKHVALLTDPRFSHSANSGLKAQMVGGLQSSYGNTYVQRVIMQAQAVTGQPLRSVTAGNAESPASAAETITAVPASLGTRIQAWGLGSIKKGLKWVGGKVKEAGEAVLKKAFETALGAAGVDKKQVMGLLSKAGSAIMSIFKNPGKFVSTLVKALGQGFRQFADNIGKHLMAGLMSWLFGTMSKAGITLPKDFSPKSILQLVLQILGVTVDNIKSKLTAIIGTKNMARLEKAWEIISTFMKDGLGGLWGMLKDYISDLKDNIIDQIKNWLMVEVVKAAVLKIISMFNPVTGLINVIKMIYNVIKFLVEKGRQIMQLFSAVTNSVYELAMGNVKPAADKIEQTLASLIPIAIGFLASLLGITGLADKIKDIIKKIQAKVDKALDMAIGKVAGAVKKLFGRAKEAFAGSAAGKLYGRGKEKTKELYGKGKAMYESGKAKAQETFEKMKSKAAGALEKGAGKVGLGPKKKPESKDVIAEVRKAVALRTRRPFASPAEAQNMIGEVFATYRPLGLKELRLEAKEGDRDRGAVHKLVASASPDVGVGNLIIRSGVAEPKAGEIKYGGLDGKGRATKAWGWLVDKGKQRDLGAQSAVSHDLNQLVRELGLDVKYDAGHLIADRYGGAGDKRNLVPMESSANRGWVGSFENHVAGFVKEAETKGDLIYAEVHARYDDDHPVKGILDAGDVKDMILHAPQMLARVRRLFTKIPHAVGLTKLGRRTGDGKEIPLDAGPMHEVRKHWPRLSDVLKKMKVRGRVGDIWKEKEEKSQRERASVAAERGEAGGET